MQGDFVSMNVVRMCHGLTSADAIGLFQGFGSSILRELIYWASDAHTRPNLVMQTNTGQVVFGHPSNAYFSCSGECNAR